MPLRFLPDNRRANVPATQPPKRRGAAASSSSAAGPKRARPSKLAKENDITAEEENEIREVFQLFADAHEDFTGEKEGVIPREDVRKALVYVAPLLERPIPLNKLLLYPFACAIYSDKDPPQSPRSTAHRLSRTRRHPLRPRPNTNRLRPLQPLRLRCGREAPIPRR